MWKQSTINLVYAISFLDVFAVGLTVPVFSTHLRELGCSHTVIGLSNSLYSGIQILSGPIIGGWTDIRGRKSVLKITLLLCGISYCLLGVTQSIFVILALRIILGITKQTQSICKAVISDLVPKDEQTEVFGRSVAFSSFGFIVGPFIAGHLSEVKHGFTYVSGLTAILFFINIGISSLLPEVSEERKPPQNSVSVIGSIKNEFTKAVVELRDIDWREHWDSFLLRFLFSLSITCYFSNQGLFLKEKYELSQKHIGYIISFFSTIGSLSAFFLHIISGYYKDDHSCYTRISHFFGIMTLCFIGIHVSPSLSVLLLLLVPFSVVSTGLRVVSMELILKKSEKIHRGSLSGASNSVMSVGRLVTPFFTGVISDTFGEQSVMLVAVIAASLAMTVSLYMKKYVVQAHVKNK